MLKKLFRGAVSAFLAVAIAVTTCTSAMAASSKATYIKDVVISYGETEDEAKNWLTENGYEVLDYNLNEGADDPISTKRAVYLGYTTTNDAEEAITDMRLMNMKGGYSVQDYQMLLEEQKADIQSFLNDFLIAVDAYRANYSAGQQRAIVAHEMLNLLYDDDSQQYMGDLLLNKVKEEYSTEEWNELSDDVKSQTGEMTTILMQGNSNAVLAVQQLIAMATDSTDSVWADRYAGAKTYDEMLEELMNSDGLPINEAENQLATEYDEDAQKIASKLEDYKTYLGNYTNVDLPLSASEEEIKAYAAEHEDFDQTTWFAAGAQYELLGTLTNDDISLLDLITDEDYDLQGTDRYLLYPLVSVLTDGQRACLDLLSMYYIVAMGFDDDNTVEQGTAEFDFDALKEQTGSVYEGIDRSIFTDEVALTNEAIRFQASSGQNAVEGLTPENFVTSYILAGVFALSACLAVAAFRYSSYLQNLPQALRTEYAGMAAKRMDIINSGGINGNLREWAARKDYLEEVLPGIDGKSAMAKYFHYAGVALVAISVVIFAVTLWNTYQELSEYYNVEFTPIPKYMVDESVDENDAKVYTYYTAVTCNREEKNMVTDANKLLKNYGDLNGDVGREWVALYTTKDKNAGNPLTELKVQYEDSNLPDESYTALSMFGEDSAQNLTNKLGGYTYSDSKNGIYLFYNTDTKAFAGSVFTETHHVMLSVASAAVIGIAAFFVGIGMQKKKIGGGGAAHA